MEWSKIKNIIILILLMVNVFLLVLTANRELQSRQYREEALLGAVEVLRQQGVTVEAHGLPEESGLSHLAAERDKDAEARMAEALLGVVVRTDDGGRATYQGNGGEAWFRSNGSFSVRLANPLPAEEQDAETHAVKTLAAAGYSCEATGLTRSGDEIQVTLRQSWEGTPLFTCKAVARYENGALMSIDGQRLTGTPTPSAKGGTNLDVATLLIRFLGAMRESGHVFTCVESLIPGYRTANSPGGMIELEPVWEARTDGGVFYIDGATGALSQ